MLAGPAAWYHELMPSRDPLSVWFDDAALHLLQRAYANKDAWTPVYLARPTPGQRALALTRYGVDVSAVDDWGEVRWVRAFKRSVYWNLKHHGTTRGVDRTVRRQDSQYPPYPLEWQTGELVMRQGWPRRHWAIRVRLHSERGQAARDAADRKVPLSERWSVNGRATSRRSSPGQLTPGTRRGY